ncbi:MAG: cytochrome c oxidase assembly protein [Gaiellales bacterium]
MTPSPTSFTFEPLFLALAAAAAILYWRAWRRETAPAGWRAWLFGTGLVLIAASLNSPLETIAVHYLLIFHLFQNVVIADVAPLLLVVGLTPAMREAIAARGGRAFATITRLRIALPIWLLGWYLIHLAGFYDTALRNPWLLNVEHLVLVAIGLVFWWPLVSDVPHRHPTLHRLAYLLAGFILSTFLGLAFTFGEDVFYGFYEDVPRLWGISAVKDQNLAGILMTAEQAILFLAAMAVFLVRLLDEEETRERLRGGTR